MGRDARLPRESADGNPSSRDICDAMLAIVGEVGYPTTRVEHVLQRSGASRTRFYQLFANKEECFAAAYAAVSEELADELLASAESAGDCIKGLREALAHFLGFVAANPATAAALLVQARAAGDAVVAAQQKVSGRLTGALEAARRQENSIRTGPSSLGPLMIGAIENMARGLLVSGEAERAPAMLGDLLYVVVLSYFGEDAAFAAMDAANNP